MPKYTKVCAHLASHTVLPWALLQASSLDLLILQSCSHSALGRLLPMGHGTSGLVLDPKRSAVHSQPCHCLPFSPTVPRWRPCSQLLGPHEEICVLMTAHSGPGPSTWPFAFFPQYSFSCWVFWTPSLKTRSLARSYPQRLPELK